MIMSCLLSATALDLITLIIMQLFSERCLPQRTNTVKMLWILLLQVFKQKQFKI